MSTRESASGSSSSNNEPASQGGASERTGLGGPTSGEQGATPDHETMQETGGSGGSGLTRNQAGAVAADPGETEPSRDGGEAEASGTAATSAARGAQDTRGRQAGRSDTGLGTPETGANQTPADMPPKTK